MGTAVERAGGGSVGTGVGEPKGRKNSIDDILSIHKDRSLCTPQELEQIRRERNRIHARRTRERKKKMLKLTQSQVRKLEQDNKRLLRKLALTLPSEVISSLGVDMQKVTGRSSTSTLQNGNQNLVNQFSGNLIGGSQGQGQGQSRSQSQSWENRSRACSTATITDEIYPSVSLSMIPSMTSTSESNVV